MKDLPFPAWDLFPSIRALPVMTQLGCPFACVFCCHNSTRVVRYRPVEHVLEEVDWLLRTFDPTSINFVDETFGLQPDRSLRLLEGLARLNRRRQVRFSAQTRVDHVTEDLVRAMKRAGFGVVELGVESGDPAILSLSGKDTRIETVEEAVRMAGAGGLDVWLKFMLGLPGETVQSIRRSIDLSVRLNPARLSVAVVVPYPGSQVFEWARRGQQGYRLVSRDWRDFDKYAGKCVRMEGLSPRRLQWMQARMYLETLLRNGRAGDLCRMVLQNSALALSFLWTFFRRAGAR